MIFVGLFVRLYTHVYLFRSLSMKVKVNTFLGILVIPAVLNPSGKELQLL